MAIKVLEVDFEKALQYFKLKHGDWNIVLICSA